MECGAPVKKLMHPVNISFKGSGFYSTDYKNGKTPAEKTDAKTTGSETKTESGSNGGKKSDSSSGSSTEKASKKD